MNNKTYYIEHLKDWLDRIDFISRHCKACALIRESFTGKGFKRGNCQHCNFLETHIK